MHALMIAGFLALAGAQTTIDPLVLIEIFGTNSTTRQPLEEVNIRESRQSWPVQQGTLDSVFGPTSPTGIGTTNFIREGLPVQQGILDMVFGNNGPNPIGTTDFIEQGLPVQQGILDMVFGNNGPNPIGPTNFIEQGRPVDKQTLDMVFGPKGPTRIGTTNVMQITVKPTEGTSTFIDTEGQPCQCVPYYLCNINNVGVDVNNASVTGYGTLDIRFGEGDTNIKRKCQESVEVCCVIPKHPTDVPTPPPNLRPEPGPAKGCGYRNPLGLGVFVTGGTGAESQFDEFPWVAALLDARDTAYAGVGVIIHPQVVMTGAHIAHKYGALIIRAGEWDTQTDKEIYPYVERNVQTTIIHENFMADNLKNDIALLLLDSPLTISQHINVICMPNQDEVFDNSKNCVANGWGKKNFGQSNRYAVILKKVEVDMVPYTRCNTLLKRTRLGHNFKLHSSFVCAGGEAGQDTCQGDGGGGLACPIGNNRYKLTGLVSWGIGCGQQDVPAVYTNVPLFRNWVDDKMAAWGLGTTSYRISE